MVWNVYTRHDFPAIHSGGFNVTVHVCMDEAKDT